MTKPNLFIVGAPKCGTTALASYLSCHPEIFITRPKEPNYFSDDLPMKQESLETYEDYLSLYDSVEDEKVIGEASVWYLYSKVALQRVNALYPNSKFIIMLRNPAELVLSMHAQHLYVGIEGEEDFTKAWERQFSGFSAVNVILRYADIGMLGSQVERALRVISRDRVFFVLLDDLKINPKSVYEDVLNFLGVTPDDRDEFPVVNQRKKVRSRLLMDFIYETPVPIVKTLSFLKAVFRIDELGVLKRLARLNTEIEPRTQIQKDHRFLLEFFRDDVERLSVLIGKDLSDWL